MKTIKSKNFLASEPKISVFRIRIQGSSGSGFRGIKIFILMPGSGSGFRGLLDPDLDYDFWPDLD